MSSLSKNQKYTLLVLIAGVFVTLLGVGLAYWNTTKNEEIAARSGAFDKGDLRLLIGKYTAKQNVRIPIVVSLDYSNSKQFVVGLPLKLYNSGQKTLENVQMVSKYPNTGGYNIIPDSILKLIEMDGASRRHVNDGVIDQVTTNLGTINPKETLETADYKIMVDPIVHDSIAEILFPNRPDGIKMVFSENVEISITAKDDETKYYAFSLALEIIKTLRQCSMELLKIFRIRVPKEIGLVMDSI